MSNPLIGFLTARLDEDEHLARLTAAEGGVRIPFSLVPLGPFDPARVLRQVEAHRGLMAEHSPTSTAGGYGDHCTGCGDDFLGEGRPIGECAVLRHLATIWSDHPDYRQEWKP